MFSRSCVWVFGVWVWLTCVLSCIMSSETLLVLSWSRFLGSSWFNGEVDIRRGSWTILKQTGRVLPPQSNKERLFRPQRQIGLSELSSMLYDQCILFHCTFQLHHIPSVDPQDVLIIKVPQVWRWSLVPTLHLHSARNHGLPLHTQEHPQPAGHSPPLSVSSNQILMHAACPP